ncbi:MAG: hypothetical protein L0L22_13790 [Staphylococcus equorum]|nr:hypothetical protein [Staphylococcus equorum]
MTVLTSWKSITLWPINGAGNLAKAQKATLHNAIWNKSEVYLARGYVTIGELNNFDILYHAYKAVEGNHTGDMLHAKVKALPVRDEGILSRKEVT